MDNKNYKLYFDRLLDNMSEGAAIHQMVYDEHGVPIDYILIKINKSYEKITGLFKESVEGKLATEVYGHVPLLDVFSGVVSNQKPIKFDNFYEPMGKYFKISVSPWNDIGFITIFFDISETIKHEKLEKYTKLLYASFFDNNTSICVLINPYTLAIKDANDMAVEFYGYSKEEFKQLTIDNINTASKEKIKVYIDNVLYNNKKNYIFKHRIKSGEIKNIEAFFNTITIDNETLIVATVSDLTDKDKSELALQISERKLARAEILSKTGNWELNVESGVITASEGMKTIYELQHINGNNILFEYVKNMPLDEYIENNRIAMADLIKYNTPYDVVFKLKTYNDTIKTVRSIGKYDAECKTIFGVMKDITNEKNKEEELEKSNAIKSTFLSNVSHELRTPMTSIIGFSDILLSRLKDGKTDILEKERFLKSINSNAKHLDELLTNILDYSKIETDKFDLLYEKFDIKEIFEELNDIFYEVNNKRNLNLVKLEFIYGENIKLVTDYLRLKQVLYNIISNSIKFTKNGNITISYEVNNLDVIFKISDTGIGIHKDNIKNVFDRFWQNDSSSRKMYSGTGLGLSISKSITTLLSGDIWLESELDKGTTFYVKIPLEELHETEEDETDETDIEKILNKNLFKNKNVLIIDEIPTSYSLLGIYLNSLHINITSASNCGIALEKYNKQKDEIDLIFLDLNITEDRIINLCKKLKSINNECVIILKSGTGEIRNDSIDYFLEKPINKDKLILILDKIWQK